ncbi:hypothetical protein [Corynebacterium fournieri]|nr:hypothetical protein [Corynebacterium fournieri]WJY98324.1 hypothetical protein CFOUR_09700 [Corynebacterium fournieri]
MPFDLKSIQKALKTFKTFATNFADLFQNTPKSIKNFAGKVSK